MDLRQLQVLSYASDPSESKRGNVYSCLRACVTLQRRQNWFMWNVILPPFLFTSLTPTSCLVPLDEEGALSRTGSRSP
jgi:hypothetical protein